MVQHEPRALGGFLRLAAHGYHLAPIRIRRGPDGRKRTTYFRDRGAGWGEIATTDPDQIRRWWDRYGSDLGFLIACAPSGIVVIDLDLKPSAEIDAVSWWAAEGLPTGPVRVDTPSGGQHLYFRQRKPDPVANSTGAIGSGVDVRGVGGQYGGLVHAPGTAVADGEPGEVYRLLDELVAADELPEIPPEIVARIPETRRTRSERARDGAGGRSHQLSWISGEVKRLAGLVREMPPSEGVGFRSALMGTAMMAGRLAVAQGDDRARPEAFLRGLAEHVWGSVDADDERWIQTGLDDGEADPYTIEPEDTEDSTQQTDPDAYQVKLDRKVNELRLIQDARDVLSSERLPALPPIAETVVWDDDLDALPPPSWAVPGLLPERAVGWLGGPSGAYKSFVAVSLAASLAYGRPVLGYDPFVPNGTRRVVYVAAEGASGVGLRIRALRHRFGIRERGRLAVYPRALDLTSERDVGSFVEWVTANEVGFIVVDTFRQTTVGVNENDNTEVGMVLSRLLALRDERGVSTILVDHTNKSASGLADLGGAGAKRANTDYVLMVDMNGGQDRGPDVPRALRVAKFKDARDGGSWPIHLETVQAVTDAEGIPSAVVLVTSAEVPIGTNLHGTPWWEDPLPDEVDQEITGSGRDHAREIVRFLRRVSGNPDGYTRDEIRKAVEESPRYSATGGMSRQAWHAGWACLRRQDAELVVPEGASNARFVLIDSLTGR